MFRYQGRIGPSGDNSNFDILSRVSVQFRKAFLSCDPCLLMRGNLASICGVAVPSPQLLNDHEFGTH